MKEIVGSCNDGRRLDAVGADSAMFMRILSRWLTGIAFESHNFVYYRRFVSSVRFFSGFFFLVTAIQLRWADVAFVTGSVVRAPSHRIFTAVITTGNSRHRAMSHANLCAWDTWRRCSHRWTCTAIARIRWRTLAAILPVVVSPLYCRITIYTIDYTDGMVLLLLL